MALFNLISLDKQKTKKNNKRKSVDTNPLTVFQYSALGQSQLQLDKPVPNLKTISLLETSECDTVTLLPAPKPTVVNFVDGNLTHIPCINAKVSNTNPPKSETTINKPTNTAASTAANTVKGNFEKMTKKKKTKAAIARQLANAQARFAAAQAQVLVPVPVQVNLTPIEAGNPAGPSGNANQQPSVSDSTLPNLLANRQNNNFPNIPKKLWKKQKGFSVNLKWTAPGVASTSGNKPSDRNSPGISETSQDGSTAALQASESPTAVSTPETNQGSIIPTLENTTKKPSITLKTKKILQQEMVRQRLNWVKQDVNAAGNVAGTSAVLQIGNQSVPPNDTPPIVDPPQAMSAVPTAGSTIPILENRTVDPTPRSSAGSFFMKSVPTPKPPPSPRGLDIYGTSAVLQVGNQSVPPTDTQLIVDPSQATSAVPTARSTIPILENRAMDPTPRSSAGSFFMKTVPIPKPPPSPRGLDIYTYRYPKGVPRSFLIQQNMSNEPTGTPITADSPIWPSGNNMIAYSMNTQTLAQPSPVNMGDNNMNPPTSPIFVQTENPVDVQQPYSPSDIYLEQGTNPEPPELESESSEQNQSGQKRLSAFQRLGPLSQPKKPKLTINLNLKKDQPIREVVNDTDDDPDKYTPVHLRKDILTSTDETVTTYLPYWPWRKNVAVRKSVTAKSSRSVMILQQEQMEEAYEKENVFIQITVKGYPSTWTKERVLDAILENVRGYSLIPCFTEFYQHECKFLVLRSRSALIVLHKTGFYIHKDGVELTITISIPVLTDRLDFIPRIILRKRMLMGLEDKKLNLNAFTLQDDISHFIYFPLYRLSNQTECVQLQNAVNWNHLVELDLSHNRLTDVSGFDLANAAPKLKHLNLSYNCLERITLLLKERLLPLKTIHLEGNPLCHDYTDPEHYIKVIRMMFPEVVEIDGVPIHQKGTLPNHIQNYCPEEAQEVSEKFLEIYFPLLDSGPEDRSLIQGMYEDDATLTITYCYKLRYGKIYRNFRNLFLYARFLDEGETDSVVGAMAITKLINRWPHTEHDPFTFTVDVMYHTETTTILRICGVLKLAAETLAEDEHLLSFSRTVVLHSEDGAEYKIHNEMVYWDEPTAAASRAAFRVNTISQKNFNLKIESTNDEDLRGKFLKIFMKLTTMERKICERCLEINNWNFKLALEHFTKLLKLNNLESLTQEVQDAS